MTISKLSILTLPALLFFACSNSPKDSIENMYNALQTGDIVKLANNTDESLSISLIIESLKECSLDKNKIKDEIKLSNDCLREKYSNLNYKKIEITDISNDTAYAEVILIENNKENVIKLEVKKIDGKWMVAGRKKQL